MVGGLDLEGVDKTRIRGSCASTDRRPHPVVACLRSFGVPKYGEGGIAKTEPIRSSTTPNRSLHAATQVTYQPVPISVDGQEPKSAVRFLLPDSSGDACTKKCVGAQANDRVQRTSVLLWFPKGD